MKNLKTIIYGIVALILGVGGTSAYLGYTGDNLSQTFTIYGSQSAATSTVATTTNKILSIGSNVSTLNLNIKTWTTSTQYLSIYPSYSNESDCSSATFYRSNNLTASGAYATGTQTVYRLNLSAGYSYNNLQIIDLNTKCLKLNFDVVSSTSATAEGAIMYISGSQK